MHLLDVVYIEALRDRHGRVPPRRVERELARRDLLLGELLDEELRLLDPDQPRRTDPHWTPWLADRDTGGIDTAVRTAERMGNAFLDLDGFGDDRDVYKAGLELVSEVLDDATDQGPVRVDAPTLQRLADELLAAA